MKTIAVVFGGMVIAGSLWIAGCGEHEHRVVVEREPRPVVVEERPVVVERPATVIVVREAPPREIVEVMPAPPSHEHIWIAGYYIHDGHRYTWVHGHYEMPPHHGAHWEAPMWTHESDGWHHHEGHWH